MQKSVPLVYRLVPVLNLRNFKHPEYPVNALFPGHYGGFGSLFQ